MTTRNMALRLPGGGGRSLGGAAICKAIFTAIAVSLLGWIFPSPAQPVLPNGSQAVLPATDLLLRPGVSGRPVQQLQNQLAQQGFYPGVVDGLYGAETADAVRSLQRQEGLAIDGIVGAQTWQALAQNNAILTLPSPLLQANLVAFTPLVVAAPPPPPSALWLALMPLVPITGGALTYWQRRLQRRQQVLRRRRTR